jgi:hypothetical protein
MAAVLPWTVIRLGPLRAVLRARASHRGASARAHRPHAHPPDPDLAGPPRHLGRAARRRPTVPVPATSADVTRYVEAYSELLARLR